MLETRTITKVRMYKLMLNPMTDRVESSRIVAVSDDYERLVNWYMSQFSTTAWTDDNWYKVFKSGSAIEWYNPCDSLGLNELNCWGHGIGDEWIPLDVYSDIRNSEIFV